MTGTYSKKSVPVSGDALYWLWVEHLKTGEPLEDITDRALNFYKAYIKNGIDGIREEETKRAAETTNSR